MLMIRPNPLAYMCGSAARMRRKGASSIRASIPLNSAGSNSSIGATFWMPALLTRMSQSRLRAVRASTSNRSTVQAVPPSSSARAAAPDASTSATTTFAPRAASARAQAAPIPLPPPVTSALRPFKELSMELALRCRANRRRGQSMPQGVGFVHVLERDALGFLQRNDGDDGDRAGDDEVDRGGEPGTGVLEPLGCQQRSE